MLLKSWCCWLCEFDRVVAPLHFHECEFAQQFQKNREKMVLNIIFPTLITVPCWVCLKMGTPKIGLSNFFLNVWWPFIWGGHPPFISLVISPVYPWLRAPHMCPRLEAAVVKNFAVKCGKHVGVSIHMGTPLSLDGWFPRENPWINGWWWLGGTPHDLGNLHLKLTILVIKKTALQNRNDGVEVSRS